jgi:hypothetical protein
MSERFPRATGLPALAFICTLLSGCGSMPWEDPDWQAKVENRPVPSGNQAKTARMEVRDEDLRKTVERQSRRIAELEARPGAEGEARQVTDLLAYAQRMASASVDEQGREYDAARQEFARDSSLVPRLKVAIALATPNTGFHDDARAATLLDPVASQAARTPLRQFAVLLHGQINERLREQKRVAQLKEQIDGLRAIDRSLIDRDPGLKAGK